MKKLFVIAIIVILAFSQFGYYFLMRSTQQEWKEAMKEKAISVKGEELEIISLTDNQQKINWEDEGKEFLLNGRMYDVVRTEKVDGKIILYCINDNKEKELVDNYNSATKQNSSDGKKKDNVDNSITLFIEPVTELISISQTIFDQKFAIIDPYFSSNLIKDISPPPKS